MGSFTKTTTKKFTLDWVRHEFMQYAKFREARSNMKVKAIWAKCFKCSKPFADDEMISIGSFGRNGNKGLCRNCGDELSADLKLSEK